MPNNNKQAKKANNSSLYAPTFYCRALWLGVFDTITTFHTGIEAVEWYNKMTSGWRRYFCVAMAYYDWGGTRKMMKAFDRYALAVDSSRLSDADIHELMMAGRY